MQILDFQNKTVIMYSPGFNLSCGSLADNLWTDSFSQRFRLTNFPRRIFFYDSQICEKRKGMLCHKEDDPWPMFGRDLNSICLSSVPEVKWTTPNVSKASEFF